MLKSIRIQNLALIQEADIQFEPGFCAVTGETGAGKSVFLTSLKLCTGERATAQMVRHGADKASVEGIFLVQYLPSVCQKLQEMDIELDDGEITIQREIFANGKNRARINGTQVTMADLAQIGEQLLQLHGQSEQILLRDTRTHGHMLDDFGNHNEALLRYQGAWSEWQKSAAEELELRKRATELAAQKDFLQFQEEELRKAHLVAGEDEALSLRLQEASGIETRRKQIDQSLDLLDGAEGIVSKIAALQKNLQGLQNHASIAEFLAPLNDADISLHELERALRSLSKAQPLSPAEIERDNSRIALLQRLQRKYRTDLAGLLELRDRRAFELSTLNNLDDELIRLAKRVEKWRAASEEAGLALRTLRQASARKMDRAVEEQIHTLGMAKATFQTRMTPCEPNQFGMDAIEFMIAPNAGEGLKTLRQAVSGGELSRVLLAFKSVLAARDRIPVLVFDEVDSGISGEIAHRIGACLAELGKSHQVLTITHLHQVASRAQNQLFVVKHEIEGRTFTEVKPLDPAHRIQEIARMLGDPHSPAVREHARQLLQETHDK